MSGNSDSRIRIGDLRPSDVALLSQVANEAAKAAVAGTESAKFVYFDGWVQGGNVSIRPFGQGSLMGELGEELGLTNARHDLVCLHLHDPRESELPAAGLVTIEDAETGELLEVDSSRPSVREKFARTNADRLAELDRALQRAGVDTLRFSTAEAFAQTLQHFFETRRGRRRG